MQHPIERPTLHEIVATHKASKKDLTAVIIVSDVTRQAPTEKLLPYVLRGLHKGAIPEDYVTILFALGIHGTLSKREIKTPVSEDVFDNCCISHGANDCAFVGTTSQGVQRTAKAPKSLFRCA